MAYRVVWELLGQDHRCRDGGPLEGRYESYGDASVAVSAFLSGYSDAIRNEDGTSWLARRSPDANLSVRVRIETAAEASPWHLPPAVLSPTVGAAAKL